MNIVINDPTANIDIYPQPDKSHPADSKNQLTIGDLHGNALKLIYFLVRQNVITLDEKLYPELVRIYKLPANDLTKEDLASFNSIIASITALPVGSVRLIGDELCDRGSNDYFTLKVLERLNDLNVPIEILVSNHSNDFMDQFETQDEFINFRLDYLISHSMTSLQTLISKGLVERKTIDGIVNQHIVPAVKALSYTLDKENNKITLYSHAAVDLSVIASLAKKLEVTYCDDSVLHLAQTIDFINAKITLHLRNHTLNSLYNREALMECDEETLKNHFPFVFIMWNRNPSILQRPLSHAKGYAMDFVHGHDSQDPTQLNLFNLDNSLGKCAALHRDDYSILYSQELPSYRCDLLNKSLPKLEFKEDKTVQIETKPFQPQKSAEEIAAFESQATDLFAELKKADLLTDENRQLLLDKVYHTNITRITHVVTILRSAGILNHENFQKVLTRKSIPAGIYRTFHKLNSLNQETFNKIIANDSDFSEILNAFEMLSEDKTLFTADIALLLMQCGEESEDLMTIISLNKNWQTLQILSVLAKHPAKAHIVYQLLKDISAEEQTAYIPALLEAGENWPEVFTAFATLHKQKLANPEYIQLVLRYKDHPKTALLLIMMDQAKVLSPKYSELLTQIPQQIDLINIGIKLLIKCNLATPNNMDCLFQAGNHFDKVAKALVALNSQYRTPYVLNLIAKYPNSAEEIASAINILHNKEMVTEGNLFALEKSLQQLPATHPELCAKLLCQLSQLNMLDTQTRELATMNALHQPNIEAALNEFFAKSLLTSDLCAAIVKHGKVAHHIIVLFLNISTYGFLTPEIQSALIANAEHADSLNSALVELGMHTLLNYEYGKMMLENSAHAAGLAKAIVILDSAKLTEYLPEILKYPAHAQNLANALKSLQDNKLLDPTTSDIMFAYPHLASYLGYGLTKLFYEKNNTAENRSLFTYFAQQSKGEHQGFFMYTLPALIGKLKSAGLLNTKNIDLLKRLTIQQLDNVSNLLFKIESYRIFNETNFLSLVTLHEQTNFNSKSLHDLLDRLQKVDLVTYAKVKRSQATLDKLLACAPLLEELNCELKAIKPLTVETFEKILKEKSVKLTLIPTTKTTSPRASLGMFSYQPMMRQDAQQVATSQLEIRC